MFWVVRDPVSLEILRVFPSGRRGWDAAFRWALGEGGELAVELADYVSPRLGEAVFAPVREGGVG